MKYSVTITFETFKKFPDYWELNNNNFLDKEAFKFWAALREVLPEDIELKDSDTVEIQLKEVKE